MLRTKVNDIENIGVMIKNSFINLGAASLTKILTILFVPIYTRVLTTEEFGQIELVTILGNFLIILYPLNIQAALGRIYFEYKNSEKELKTFISTILILIGLMCGLQLCSILGVSQLISDKLFYKEFNYYLILNFIVVGAALRVYLPVVLKLLQNRGDSVISSWFSISYTLLGVLGNIFFIVILRKGVYGFAQAYLVTSILTFIGTAIYLYKDLNFRFNFQIGKDSLSFSYPLLISSLFLFLYQYIDRFILAISNSMSDTGIYALATKIALLLSLLHVAMNRVLNPFIYSSLSSSNPNIKKIERITNYAIVLYISVGLFLSLFSYEIVSVLAPQSYIKAAYIAPILILAFIIQGFYFNSIRILTFFKKTKIISISSIVIGSLNVLLGFYIIPRYGATGAAFVFLVTIIIHFLIVHTYAKKLQSMNNRFFDFFIIISSGVFVVLFFSFYHMNTKFIEVIIKGVVYIIFMALVGKVMIETKDLNKIRTYLIKIKN